MAIYRGPGGAGDATNDATSQAILAAGSAQQSAASAAASATSASQASTSATNSASSATSSANSATTAASSANSASTSATNAANSATAAQTAQTAAELAETNAETAEANAETAEANATASASLAQEWATKTSGPVAGGEYSSKYNAQLAATSATNAANSATSASTSASAASTSATNAATSATSAANSASNAASSASNASTSASTATSAASTATTQASNAASSATAASTSATNAATSETNAAASATSAASSATSASSSATSASNSASSASTSATNAAASAVDAQSSEDAAAAYAASINPANFLTKANNLSDLTNTSTARTNLGVAIGIDVQAYSPTLSSYANGATLGFKNRIINGAFNIWQRGTSSSVGGYQTADRWLQRVEGTTTFSQETSVVPTGFREALKWTTGAAGSYGQVLQWIETANLYDLRGQVVTVSALVRCNSTYVGAAVFAVGYSSTSELSSGSYSGVSFTNQTGAVTSSGYTLITATFTVPSNTVGLYVGIVPDTVQNSGATLYMAGVQLEKGSTATSFDYRPYGTELALCQRYYFKYAGAGIDFQDALHRYSTTGGLVNVSVPVSMRTSPTVYTTTTAYGRGVFYDTSFGVSVQNITSLAVAVNSSSSNSNIILVMSHAPVAGTYMTASFDTNGGTTDIGLSAEL